MIGQSLGHYQVVAKIGEGGMGEVYRARDTKLDRDVALKVLPEAFTADPDRLVRFEREAKVLASLNHPNIAAIHGIEEAEGTRALVLELVEGPTLAERIAQGPIPVDEALPIATQIAEALEAAHELGVIHRDLKPANVKVRADGTVKVLDFGLAKALDTTPAGDPSQSPTLTAAATQIGVIMGTAAYMSPEQAKGLPVDKRADIWAFGAVLFEMLTGKVPFQGEDLSTVLARVIEREPAWDALPATVSPVVVGFLRCCLEKSPSRRIHDIADMRLALDGALQIRVTAPTVTARLEPRRQWLPWTAAVILSVATGVVVWGLRGPESGAARRSMRLTVPAPEATSRAFEAQGELALSPDGSLLVYTEAGEGRGSLYARDLGEMDAELLVTAAAARFPAFSPDGQWIAFADGRLLKRVSRQGGAATLLGELPLVERDAGSIFGLSWAGADTIIVGSQAGLYRFALANGSFEAITPPGMDSRGQGFPSVLPGGDAVVFNESLGDVFTTREGQLAVVNLETGEHKQLGLVGKSARYVETGHLLYATAAGTLQAVPFDLIAIEPTGGPISVVENVLEGTGRSAAFSVSHDGLLVYAAGVRADLQRTLVWLDRAQREVPIDAPPREYLYARIAPDGTRAALTVQGERGRNVWMWDIQRHRLTPLAPDVGEANMGIWSHDSRRVLFNVASNIGQDVFWVAADGAGNPQQLTERGLFFPTSVTSDGTQAVLSDLGRGGITTLSLEGDHAITTLIQGPARNGEVSPNGRWIAYDQADGGQREIYVRSLADIDGGAWPITGSLGGQKPAWAPNSDELYYVSQDQRLMAVAVEGADAFGAGSPSVVADGDYFFGGALRNYDVDPTGERFLMIKSASAAGDNEIVMVTNWFEELKRLVPGSP